ncbi:MAG TPA: glycosyltransferase family 39 protein [Candidatus Aquilonibacter sp.]|nr:glycosyltransferase family 39 protein [Candidatus Aquilonibacter sp.]
MADSNDADLRAQTVVNGKRSHLYLIVILIASAIYLGCMIAPPYLMDDVDAVQASIAREMVGTHDWVTPHIDGIAFLEKAPLVYWAMALSMKTFGVHDWAARLPSLLSVIALCWLVTAYGFWAFKSRAGFYAGLCMATCIGLFLFTRIILPDVMLTFAIALAFWSFQRALDEEEQNPRLWSFLLAASLGVGLLTKSMIAVAIPVGGGLVYLALTHQLFLRRTWQRLRPFSGAVIALAIAAPWHILAAIRNPPFWAWTLKSGPGMYHGFLWFYFINEQVLRFLNLRYPHDYDTFPRAYFWLCHLVWLFPWSVYFPAVFKLAYRPKGPEDRAAHTHLLALCWAGFVLIFFTFSTTQEYYSMPCYPAFGLLLGSAMASGSVWIKRGSRALCIISACAAAAVIAILILVRHVATPGDIVSALTSNPAAYKESLGHMEDLTLDSFAYLRLPLVVAGIAFLIGAIGTFFSTGRRAFLAAALMMIVFFHAARIAMISFDPLLSSHHLAEAFLHSPDGTIITEGHFFDFSSVFFYAQRNGLLSPDKNGRVNLEYGSNAPDAAKVFIDNAQLAQLWQSNARRYLFVKDEDIARYGEIIGTSRMYVIATRGGKSLFTNLPLANATLWNGPVR